MYCIAFSIFFKKILPKKVKKCENFLDFGHSETETASNWTFSEKTCV